MVIWLYGYMALFMTRWIDGQVAGWLHGYEPIRDLKQNPSLLRISCRCLLCIIQLAWHDWLIFCISFLADKVSVKQPTDNQIFSGFCEMALFSDYCSRSSVRGDTELSEHCTHSLRVKSKTCDSFLIEVYPCCRNITNLRLKKGAKGDQKRIRDDRKQTKLIKISNEIYK